MSEPYKPTNNRSNQVFMRYYQTLADLIYIFWEFHKSRIQRGEIPFAVQHTEEMGIDPVPFMPEGKIKHSRISNINPGRINIIEKFSDGVAASMRHSWMEFLELIDAPYTEMRYPSLRDSARAINENSKRFATPYVESLIRKANYLGETVSPMRFRWSEVQKTMVAGINTAAKVTTQLYALQGVDGNDPKQALKISKIGIEQVGYASSLIGLSEFSKFNYGLLNESGKLDTEKLKSFGLGKEVGCPAGLPISAKTQGYLEGLGVSPRKTMLEDFATTLPAYFEASVGAWYRDLPEEKRNRHLTPECIRILSGSVRKEAMSVKPEGQRRGKESL